MDNLTESRAEEALLRARVAANGAYVHKLNNLLQTLHMTKKQCKQCEHCSGDDCTVHQRIWRQIKQIFELT